MLVNQMTDGTLAATSPKADSPDQLSNKFTSDSLFTTLSSQQNQQIKGGYWSHHKPQTSTSLATQPQGYFTHMNKPNVVNSSYVSGALNTGAIAPASGQSSSNTAISRFSHYTAANHLDEALLT